MVRENSEHSKEVASKANEPEKPNDVEIEIPDNLEEHVEPVDGSEVSCGQEYQGLNQDDGWKVPKQMHNWNIRSFGGFITVIFALVAISNYFGSSEPPRVARNVSKNNSVQSFDSIHHKSAMLARLMNGIYLQNELTDGSFPTYDFVAEAGGIGDPSMINKIMSLEAKDAVTRMESIKALELTKPEGVEDKLNTLSKFTSAKPPTVLEPAQTDAVFTSVAALKKAIPLVFQETEIDKIFKWLNELNGALGAEAGLHLSSKIGMIQASITVFDIDFMRMRLNSFITGDSLSQAEGFVKTFETFLKRYKFNEELAAARGKFRLLQSELWDVREDAKIVDPFMSGKDNVDTLATLTSLNDFLKSIDDHLPRNLLVAFSNSSSISGNFTNDFGNGWLKEVLNEKNHLSVLEKSLEPLMNATEQVNTVVNTWNSGIRPSLIQTIIADCKKLDTIIAIKPKSGHIVTSVDNIENLLIALKFIPNFTGAAKITEMKAKFDELVTSIAALIKEADTLAKDPKFMFFTNKNILPLITSVNKEQDAAKAKAIVDNDKDLVDIKTNAQYASKKMKDINATVTTLVTFLNNLAGCQSDLNDARAWMIDNEQKDFFDLVPAVNEDIAIVQRMLKIAPKAAPNTRRKRDTSVQLMALADELAKLGPLKATVDKLKDPSNKNKKTVELKKLSSARQMAAELAYAAGALNAFTAIQNNQADVKTITDFAKAVDAEIAKLPPKDQTEIHVGWPGADKVTATFTALQPEVKKLPAALDKVKADATLNDFAEVLAVLDKVPVVKLDVTAILKSLELLKTKSNNAKAVVDVSTALKKFEGLSFASGRKKGALPPMVKKLHAFLFDFFGLVLPTTTETPPTEVPFFLIIFFIAGPPGGIWLYLWFRWIQKMKRAYRELPTKDYASDTAKSQKSVEEEKPVVTEAKPKSVKESASEVPEEDGPVEEGERKTTEQQEGASVMNEKRLAKGGQKLDKKAKSVNADKRLWGHKNRMKEQKAKTIYTVDKKRKSYWKRRLDLKAYHNWIVRLTQKIADMEAKEEELCQEIAYNRTVDKWKAMLAANKDEIKVKQDYKRRADEE